METEKFVNLFKIPHNDTRKASSRSGDSVVNFEQI